MGGCLEEEGTTERDEARGSGRREGEDGTGNRAEGSGERAEGEMREGMKRRWRVQLCCAQGHAAHPPSDASSSAVLKDQIPAVMAELFPSNASGHPEQNI